MILWILALILLGSLGMVGYYQGAIRVAFSFIGLLIASMLAMPLAGVVKPILRIIGVDHPIWLAVIAPFVVYLIILVAFKSAALPVHKRVDTYYKYRVSDTERMLWERLNQRLGACLSLANGFIYLILISVVANILGYFTFQLSTPENSKFSVKIANQLAEDLQSTKMAKAIAGFVPATESYYDGVDIMGDLYHNPLLESRLSSYPAFLGLAERTEFKELAKDQKFHEQLWLKMNPRPRLGNFFEHERMKPLVGNIDLYTNVMALLNWDLKDFKTYLETGKSPKYDEEKILGHWYYDYATSLKRAQKGKYLTAVEKIKLRQTLGALTNGILTAYTDNKMMLKVPANNANPQTLMGTWRAEASDSYALTLREGSKQLEVPASIEANKLVLRKENNVLYFEH